MTAGPQRAQNYDPTGMEGRMCFSTIAQIPFKCGEWEKLDGGKNCSKIEMFCSMDKEKE